MKRSLISLVAIVALLVQGCASSSKKSTPAAKSETPAMSPVKKMQKTMVPGKMSDLVLLVLPSGWEENYDFEKADIENNYLQMKYQKKAPVDFYLFSSTTGAKNDYIVRVDWDCKNGACTEGISTYKFERNLHQEITFRTLLSTKAMKKIGKDVAKCVGPRFQFGSMWVESGCILGFDFSETGGPLVIYKSSIMSQGKFEGPQAASLKWNPKKSVFE